MAEAKLVARANEVIDRLFALNEAMESADAFCAYLKELNARDVLVKQYLVNPSDVEARRCPRSEPSTWRARKLRRRRW